MRTHLLVWDLVAVGLFVVLGRMTHDEGMTVAAILATAAPFTGALLLGWLASFRIDPSTVRGGLVVSTVTIVGGMLLRRFVAGEGTAAPFVVVAAAFLTASMLGWRLVSHRRSPAVPTTVGRGATS